MAKSGTDEPRDKPRRPPATTPQAREDQLIAAAYDLAEKQLLAGTASSQVVAQLLKSGSPRHQAEMEKLRRENELLRVKVESIQASQGSAELLETALRAFTTYAGREEETDDNY